jgi:hypothetical protein
MTTGDVAIINTIDIRGSTAHGIGLEGAEDRDEMASSLNPPPTSAALRPSITTFTARLQPASDLGRATWSAPVANICFAAHCGLTSDIRLSPRCAKDRDRGAPHDAAPPTPPYVRVAYTAVREVSLTRAK